MSDSAKLFLVFTYTRSSQTWATFAAILVAAAPSFAGIKPSAESQKKAETGQKLAIKGDCVAALPILVSIPEGERVAMVRLRIASCEEKVGKLLDALRDYETLAKGAAEDVPGPVAETAGSALAELRLRIPAIELEITGDLHMFVDDKPVLGPTARVMLDPGKHIVIGKKKTKDGDREIYRRELELTTGKSVKLVVSEPAPVKEVPSVEPPVPVKVDVPKPITEEAGGSGQRIGGWISLGVGVGLGVGGALYFASSRSAFRTYSDSCIVKCDESLSEPVRSRQTLAFVLGGIGLGALGLGITLIATSPSSSLPAKTRAAVQLSPNGFQLYGEF